MMNPIVILFEQQLKELDYLTGGVSQRDGLAHTRDDDTVLQAHTKQPAIDTSAATLPCVFVSSASAGLFDNIIDYAEQLCRKNGQGKLLLIFLARNTDSIQHRAWLFNGDTLCSCNTKLIPEESELFSRNKGLLETDSLAKKEVGIIGLGSGGSTIAVELAKAGVCKFVLIDFDRLELSNISRHICGVDDLGRFKTRAVRDAIKQKNPYALVNTVEIDITQNQEECSDALSQVDLIIGASDNDRSRFLINEYSLAFNIPAIFGRALTRAVGGDVLRVRPKQGPCYNCLYSQSIRSAGGDDEEISQEKQAEKLLPDYTSPEEINAAVQVGLASDIAPIANLMVKLALVELSNDSQTGIRSLAEDLVADFYIWANRRENIYESWSKLEYNYDKPTILRWYGARVDRDPDCMVCG